MNDIILQQNTDNPSLNEEVVHIYTLLGYIDNKIIPINVKKIKFIYSSGTEVYAQTVSGRKISLKKSLDYLQRCVDPELFFRANRQFIINRKSIDYLEPYFNRRLMIKLNAQTPEKIIISKARVSAFLNWLQLY